MTVLSGINGPVMTSGPPVTAGAMSPSATIPAVIDGTPIRIAVLGIAAAVGLMALHAAGFRFNVGVSG